MGYIFETSDVAVWSPSLNVARLFLASVRQLEEQVHMSSGLVETMSDTINIDSNELTKFLQAVIASASLSNESQLLLFHGPVIHLLALLFAVDQSAGNCAFNCPREWVGEAHKLLGRSFSSIWQK